MMRVSATDGAQEECQEVTKEELEASLGFRLRVADRSSRRLFSSNIDCTTVNRIGKLRREMLLPLRFVIDRLLVQLERAELLRDLLVFVPFVALFVLFFLAGSDIEANFYVLSGARARIFSGPFPSQQAQLEQYTKSTVLGERINVPLTKKYTAITRSADWPSWLSNVLIPTLYDCTNPNRGYLLNAQQGQSVLAGAVRVRTQRVTRTSCSIRAAFYPSNASLFSDDCYASMSASAEQREPYLCNYTNPVDGERMYKYYPCSAIPGSLISAVDGIYDCGGYMFVIPSNTSCNVAQQFTGILQNASCETFVNDYSTRFVVVEYFLFSPSPPAFHSLKFYSEVLSPGVWLNEWTTRSFTVWSNTDTQQIAVDACFFAFVLYYWALYFYSLILVKKRGEQKILVYLLDFWNVFEVVSLVFLTAVFGFRFSWYAVSNAARSSLLLPLNAMVYPPYLDQLELLYDAMVYLNSFNSIFVFLKVLKYFRLYPRLGILTRTLSEALQSLIGIVVIFFTVVVGYAITGWLLFGTNVARYRSFALSVSSQVRLLVGDVNYDELRQENRLLAGVFFWTYIILVLFLLINFVIAVLSNSFAKVSGRAYSIPIEEELIRWVQGARAFASPSNIRRLIRGFLRLRGEDSEASLMRRAIQVMEEQYVAGFDALVTLRRQRVRKQAAEFADKGRVDFTDFIPAEGVVEDDDDELEVLVVFEDILSMLGPDILSGIPHDVWEYLWDQLMNDYDDSQKASMERSKRRLADTVQLGVEQALGDDLVNIDALDTVLAELEGHVKTLSRALRVAGATDG